MGHSFHQTLYIITKLLYFSVRNELLSDLVMQRNPESNIKLIVQRHLAREFLHLHKHNFETKQKTNGHKFKEPVVQIVTFIANGNISLGGLGMNVICSAEDTHLFVYTCEKCLSSELNPS